MKKPNTSVFDQIRKKRKERHHAIRLAVWIGVLLRVFIVAAELGTVMLFGSEALLMDALATGIDIASSLILLVFIKLAVKPPDEDHPYGHGRYEPLAGLQLGLFLAIVGFTMMVDQWFQMRLLIHEEAINPYIWIVPAVAVVLLEAACQLLKRTAKRLNSSALEAEATHFRIDAITSCFAAVTLVIAAVNPAVSASVDHLGAITIAVLMMVMGVNAARKNMHQLMDRKPDSSIFEKVRVAAMRAEGVLATEKLRIQQYGPDAQVHIDIEVDPHLSVLEAHEISRHVRLEIQKEWPSVQDVIVHIEPHQ